MLTIILQQHWRVVKERFVSKYICLILSLLQFTVIQDRVPAPLFDTFFCMIEVELLGSLYTQSLKLSEIGHDKIRTTGNPLKKTWNSGGPVLLSAPGSGPPAWLWSGHPAPGAQCRPGQPIQLGCGSLLHRLLPARLRLLQSHRYSLWQQVQNLNNLPVICSASGGQLPVNMVFEKHSFALIFVSFLWIRQISCFSEETT